MNTNLRACLTLKGDPCTQKGQDHKTYLFDDERYAYLCHYHNTRVMRDEEVNVDHTKVHTDEEWAARRAQNFINNTGEAKLADTTSKEDNPMYKASIIYNVLTKRDTDIYQIRNEVREFSTLEDIITRLNEMDKPCALAWTPKDKENLILICEGKVITVPRGPNIQIIKGHKAQCPNCSGTGKYPLKRTVIDPKTGKETPTFGPCFKCGSTGKYFVATEDTPSAPAPTTEETALLNVDLSDLA